MPTKNAQLETVNVQPTKELFVYVLTRDIDISDAVIDLIDNSVDGAKRLQKNNSEENYDGLNVEIEFDKDKFLIKDNCGGISLDLAKNYAFRFGRDPKMPETTGSVGQFGVGMKRALFKFGKYFLVESKTKDNSFSIEVDVPKWIKNKEWIFNITKTGKGNSKKSERGTKILVQNLNDEAQRAFSDLTVHSRIFNEVKVRQKFFIEKGLSIIINGNKVDSQLFTMRHKKDELHPSYWTNKYEKVIEEGKLIPHDVEVEMYVGVGDSNPELAGWYVCCNGRVVLDADKSEKTGWKLPLMPQFHGQYNRFRGYVMFRSEHAGVLPWTTTKADIDVNNSLYKQVLQKMSEQGRAIIKFLDALDQETDLPKNNRPLTALLEKSTVVNLDKKYSKENFEYVGSLLAKGEKMTTISFRRPKSKVESLQSALSITSSKRLGEELFDEAYNKHVED